MEKEILFGICADVHHSEDWGKHAWRMERFTKEANERGADFIVQLGDFTTGGEMGRELLAEWEKFKGPRYHVLGNHETELMSKEEMMAFLGMEKKYYSFDAGNYHFIVLDTNYSYENGEYRDYDHKRGGFNGCYIPPEQLRWLAADLRATDKRCFIFMHAAAEVGDWRVTNLHAFRGVLWAENERVGYNKVTMVFSGHDHADALRFKGGIYYMLVNSMSLKFIGASCTEHSSHRDDVLSSYGELKYVIPYRDPLYAFVRLKPNGLIQIIGKQSEYDGNSPKELHWEHYASPEIQYRELWMNGYGEL